jgi:CPA2 family monovalent cation:H+ antiporter-2
MQHDLMNTIVVSIAMAAICGFIARKLKFPVVLGYLIAGIIVGPFSPGFVANAEIAQQLAEIGIILLMFGVGLHFSVRDLIDVRKIAVPGALFQMFVATMIGTCTILAVGGSVVSGVLYGFSLSIASTVVMLRILDHNNTLDTKTGKIAVGWLIVEDIAIVLALVLLPLYADITTKGADISAGFILREVLLVLLKIGGFIAIMVVFGRKLLPMILVSIAKTRSNELMTLGTLAIALGFAYIAYTVFGASFALGAFLAGLVLSESQIGQKAAEKSLPLRDAFAVLFFISVGMLFNPQVLIDSPLMVLATLLIIILGKGLAAYAIATLFGQTRESSMLIAVSLAQIGEFSFILAKMSMAFELLNQEIYNLILAGALLSIALNPFLFRIFEARVLGPSKVVP